MKWFRVDTKTDSGKEPGGYQGTIDIKKVFWFTKEDASEAEVKWFGWGHPDPALENSFQAVAARTSINIWHRVSVKFSPDCNDEIHATNVTLIGSNFPSHRLWEDGTLIQEVVQGPFSSLWRSEPALGSTFVTVDGKGPFAPQGTLLGPINVN
jgi:hypothetical protein